MKKSNLFRRFGATEDGTATVEAVLWLPLFFFGFGLVFDASVMFFAEAEAMRTVQDGNRLASIGRLKSPSETEAYIEAALGRLSKNADATSVVDSMGVITSTASIPAADLGMLGFFTQLTNITLRVEADQMMEDFL